MSPEDEAVGADATEHQIEPFGADGLVVIKGLSGNLEVRRRSFFGEDSFFV